MDFFSRKLLSDDDKDDDDFNKFCNSCDYLPPDHCSSDCLEKCSKLCSYFRSIPPIISDESNPNFDSKSPHKLSNLVTITIALLSFTFLLVLCYVVYARFYSGRRRRRRDAPPPPPTTTTHQQEFLDEEHGPDLDHPIWYIRTIGLPPAVIDAIAVCKFKSGEGLIDGTECSVCLTEFEDDDTLRLLPKCNHAFHLPCIDTWLRSHTNCPMCRAPVVAQSSAAVILPPPPPPPPEETQMGDIENLGESSVRNEEQDDDEIDMGVNDFQPMRRSVSLDSLSAVRISSVFAIGKMDSEAGERKKSLEGRANCSTAMNRSVSFSGKFLMRSSTQRSSGADHN